MRRFANAEDLLEADEWRNLSLLFCDAAEQYARISARIQSNRLAWARDKIRSDRDNINDQNIESFCLVQGHRSDFGNRYVRTVFETKLDSSMAVALRDVAVAIAGSGFVSRKRRPMVRHLRGQKGVRVLKGGATAAAPRNSSGLIAKTSFLHSPGYHEIQYKGAHYRPNSTASRIIRALHENLKKGLPSMTTKQIREAAELPASGGKMYDWIVKGGCEGLWKTLIIEEYRGRYRLDSQS
jgi:hypothetical protein